MNDVSLENTMLHFVNDNISPLVFLMDWGMAKYILANDYEKNIECYDIRSIVKPGITGWAQVMFRYGSNLEDSKQKLMYDLYYIKNWSVWLEFEIAIRTFMVIFNKGGL